MSASPDDSTICHTRRTGYIILAVSVCAYAALAVMEGWFILANSANVPFSDTWNFVFEIVRFVRSGTIHWGIIFSPYAQGRPAIQRFGMLLEARYLHFNVQVIKLVSVPLTILECGCAIRATRLALTRQHAHTALVVTFPIALMIFNFANWQNLLQEWNVMNLAAVALVFLSLLLCVEARSPAQHHPWRYLLSTVAVCAIASFTGEAGTFSWVACIFVLWLPFSRDRLRERLTFSGLAVTFLALYFAGMPGLPLSYPIHHVGGVVRFAVTCLGSGVVFGYAGVPALALGVGVGEIALALIALATLLVRRSMLESRPVQVALGLIVFTVVAALSTASARLQYGIGTATASRYVVITAPMAIGIYLIAVALVPSPGRSRVARALLKRSRVVSLLLASSMAVALILASVVNDVDQYRLTTPRKAFYLTLQHVACHPAGYSDTILWDFQSSGEMNTEQKSLLLSRMAALRSAKLSIYEGDRCRIYAQQKASS